MTPALLALLLAGCDGGNPTRAPENEFPVPSRIVVSVTPFASVEEARGAESSIDWLRDERSAAGVTTAYAATEIRDHLAMAGLAVRIETTMSAHPAIVLALRGQPLPGRMQQAAIDVNYAALGEQGYAVVPAAGSVLVTANDRVGLLYGAYALLEHLGFAWYDPYDVHVPPPSTLQGRLTWPTIRATPKVRLRGFWVYAEPPVPDEFAVWLARNRLNLGGRARIPLQRKLGLQGWGGHHNLLQQEFSRPGLFDQHPDWFALIGGVRQPVTATTPDVYFNPAFCNPAVADYFAERLIQRLQSGDLQDLDVLNVWPADDRFNLFDQSPEALALGNETDNMLYFYGNVARRLAAAFRDGQLSRRVTLAGLAYFQTQRPPTNLGVARALETADYIHVFSPLERDWSGPLDRDVDVRDSNRRFLDDAAAWHDAAQLHYGVVDYQNLSVYGALTLTDVPDYEANFNLLTRGHEELYSYMHPGLRNPGPRRLTNALLARLSWSESRDGATAAAPPAEVVIRRYYEHRYGALAAEWRAIDELMAHSVDNAKEMFGTNSLSWVLLQEQIWNPSIYPRSVAASFIDRYRLGGVQDLPAAFSGMTSIRASFRGLDDSIRMQAEARTLWSEVMTRSVPPDVRRHLESDLVWFEATASRYRLLAATSDFVVAREQGLDLLPYRDGIARELAMLRHSPVLGDTVSPVNQRLFLDQHARLAGL